MSKHVALELGQSMSEHLANIRTYIKYRVILFDLDFFSKVMQAPTSLCCHVNTVDNQYKNMNIYIYKCWCYKSNRQILSNLTITVITVELKIISAVTSTLKFVYNGHT